MSYRTHNVTPVQSSSGYQSNSYAQPTTSYRRPTAYTQPSSYTQQSSQAYRSSASRPSSTVRYVSSTHPSRIALPPQPENPTRSIYRRRDSDNEPLMIRRQRRNDEIADVLPIRTTRKYPETAQNIYRQDLAFDRTANCRHDGRFHCDYGYSTSRQYKSISHATGAHNAPTPHVCPAYGVRCPRGLYQYNAHLPEYHPELVQHAVLQCRDGRFIRPMAPTIIKRGYFLDR